MIKFHFLRNAFLYLPFDVISELAKVLNSRRVLEPTNHKEDWNFVIVFVIIFSKLIFVK